MKHLFLCLITIFTLSLNAEGRLFDTFLFNNELDMLKLRLLEHDAAVDFFVIVEGSKTFTGKSKRLCFKENKELFKAFEDKIIYIIVKDLPKTGAWDREHYTRNFAISTLKELCHPDDIILHSDVDEIISEEVLLALKNEPHLTPHCLQTDFYYYNCNWKKSYKWERVFIARFEDVENRGLLEMRTRSGNEYPKVENAGWHLSYFMTPEEIADKVKSFSHTEFNKPEYTRLKNIKAAISTGKDLFKRGGNEDCIRATEEDKLPKHINVLPAMFQRD